jgi:hypothetical protein
LKGTIMADATLKTDQSPAKPTLEADLRHLAHRVMVMEDALRGARGALSAIHRAGLLDHLPSEESYHDGHNSATAMLILLENHLAQLSDAEDQEDWWVSCEITLLADRAREHRLVRYSAPIAE